MKRWGYIVLHLLGILGTGCAVQSYAPDVAPEKVTITDSPFYRFGPMQARADDYLPAGIRMRILRQEMGFSLALLDDGRTGYVANETLAAAPPRPQPRPVAKERRSGSRVRVPVLIDATLPEPDPPTPDLEAGPAEIIPDVNLDPGTGLEEN